MMRIKWANPQKQIQGRVYKRSRNTTSSSTTTNKKYKKTYPKSQYNKQVVKSLPELEDELEHSLDSLTAVTVMFDSLRHAYTTCKSEIDQSSTPTRLGDMERELLTAYDDIGIQVRQLGRHIGKLEKQIKEFHDKNNNNGCCNTSIISSSSSSSSSPISSTTTSPGTPTLILDDDTSNKNYSPPLALLPLEATSPPVYYIPPPAPVVPAANVWSCDPAFSFPIQQQDEPYRMAALVNTTTTNTPCACADCCSYNDISWSFPPPDASAPLL
ncbi:hypothetical protein BDC45DRAFT_505730 [Circinella umbellata]|nr:hypothetical protein BDC45DRAFT_505730 [Circinella umbellata]